MGTPHVADIEDLTCVLICFNEFIKRVVEKR